MPSWTDNNRPPIPQGMAGGAREERGIVPHDGGKGEKDGGLPLPAGVLMCALGGLVASTALSVVAPAMIAYAYLAVVSHEGARGRACCLAASLAGAVVMGLATSIATALSAVVACLVTAALCELVLARRLTAGALCAVAFVGAAALLGTDEAVAISNGTSVSEGISALLDYYFDSAAALGGTASAQLQAVRDVVEMLWPFAYVVAAIIQCLSALVGTQLVSHGPNGADVPRPLRLVDFDLPLWVVAVFVASVAGLAVALTVDGAVSEIALVVSANVAMAIRCALATQGLAVLIWFVRDKGASTFTRTFVGALVLYLEVQFVILSIVGLIDVWANFRHLARGGTPSSPADPVQD